MRKLPIAAAIKPMHRSFPDESRTGRQSFRAAAQEGNSTRIRQGMKVGCRSDLGRRLQGGRETRTAQSRPGLPFMAKCRKTHSADSKTAWAGYVRFRGQSGRIRTPLGTAAASHLQSFGAVIFRLDQGLESTQSGHSRPETLMSASGSQSGHSGRRPTTSATSQKATFLSRITCHASS